MERDAQEIIPVIKLEGDDFRGSIGFAKKSIMALDLIPELQYPIQYLYLWPQTSNNRSSPSLVHLVFRLGDFMFNSLFQL